MALPTFAAISRIVLGLAAVASTADAQVFFNDQTKIPSEAEDKASCENVDFGDVDLDGDWDAILANGGDAGNDQNTIWINQGGLQAGTIGVFVDDTVARFPVLEDDSRDVEFVDFDFDGDLDMYTSNTAQISNQGNRWWVNQGGQQNGTLGVYVDETAARWIGLNSATSSIADSLLLPDEITPETFIDWSCDCDFGDLDNDGDMDLVHSTYGGAFGGDVPTRLFLNDGDGHFEEFNPSGFKLSGQDILPGSPGLWCEGTQTTSTTVSDGTLCDVASSALDIDLGDTDGDFDLDILHGAREQRPRFYESRLEENGGTLGFRDVTGAVFPAGYSTGNGHYEQEMGDLDGDGDLDIYGLNWLSQFGFDDIVLENDNTGTFTNQATLAGGQADDNEGDFIDYDNDGDLDLLVANFSGANKLYRNNNNGGGPGFTLTNVTGAAMPAVLDRISLDADVADVDADGDYDWIEATDANRKNRFYDNITEVADTTAPYLPAMETVTGHAAAAADDAFRTHVYDNAPYYITWYNEMNLVTTVTANHEPIPPIELTLTSNKRYAPRTSGGQIFRSAIPGNLVGDVDYHVTSADEYGNTGASSTQSYTNTGATGSKVGTASASSVGLAAIGTVTEPRAGSSLVVAGYNVAPSTLGFFMVSTTSAPAIDLGDGFILNVGVPFAAEVILGVTDADGKLVIEQAAMGSGVGGATIYLQFVAADGTGGNTFASSRALELTFL